MTSDKEPTVIKKYANRRLYHTGTSSYVTLEGLAGLVRTEGMTRMEAKLENGDVAWLEGAQLIMADALNTLKARGVEIPASDYRSRVKSYIGSYKTAKFTFTCRARKGRKVRDAAFTVKTMYDRGWPTDDYEATYRPCGGGLTGTVWGEYTPPTPK